MREEDLSNTECSSRWENEVDIKALLCWQVQKFLTNLEYLLAALSLIGFCCHVPLLSHILHSCDALMPCRRLLY